MDPISIIGAVIVMLAALTPIIVVYYRRAEKFLVIIQMVLDLYRERLMAHADNHITEEEYAELGRKLETLAVYIDSCIDIDAWINKK